MEKTKTLKAYNVKTASGDAQHSDLPTIELPQNTAPLWECVVVKGQTFISDAVDDRGMFEVLEVKPATKFDAYVVLLRKSNLTKLEIKASSLCGNPLWRRLPDLELDEVYLSEDEENFFEEDPFSAPTRIGLGPLPDFS